MTTAINPKHQPTVNRFLKANASYDVLVNEGKEESAKGARAYSKAYDLYHSLPAREQSNLKVVGY